MPRPLTLARRAGLPTGALWLCACVSVEIDEVDRGATFPALHVEHALGEPDRETRRFVELDLGQAQGEEDALEYRIGRLGVGVGGRSRSENLSTSLSVGLLGQDNDLELAGLDLDADAGVGPYAALDVGWTPLAWLEPYARGDVVVLFGEIGTSTSGELGLRLRPVRNAALRAAWRYARYDLAGIDAPLGTTEVELDAVGFVVGLWLAL